MARGDSALTGWMRARLAAIGIAETTVGSVGIRPEAVHLAAVGEATCPARVVDVVPTGGSWIVELAVSGEKFFAIAGEAPGIAPGETTAFTVEPRRLHVFDQAGRRIAA
jgi:iron(III) transport system ATP-binding protein